MTGGGLVVVAHPTPEAFLARAEARLAEAEAEHCLVQGIALRLAANPEPETVVHLLTVEAAGNVEAFALQTAPYNWILSRAEPAALDALVAHLRAAGWPVPGVIGADEVVRSFVERWSSGSGVSARGGRRQRIYELRGVIPPPAPPGHPRVAAAGDLDVVVWWANSFAKEVGGTETREATERSARSRVADRQLFFWDDGGPVAMAAIVRPTPHGAAVSFVYTPPTRRGRGYATALVAAVSDRILGSGRRFACLFSDLANPTSNAIYQRIGYRPVADWSEWFFS